ncbi:MAG: YbjN domain-containing protein [Acidaminococcaceae bacterium]
MNKKAEQWQSFLTENKITCFSVEEMNNEINTVVYRAFLEIKGQKLPTMLVVDDSIYGMLQVRVAEALVTEDNKTAVLTYINELNKKYKVFKYYVGDKGDLCLDSCMPSTGEGFDPNIVHAVIDVVLKHLNDEYPVLMRKIWATE